jgi:hypothetical protein
VTPRQLERFWTLISTEPNTGCWLWLGTIDRDGYGKISANKKNLRAHRVAYAALVGEVPRGLQLDHLCRQRCCVNPHHLEPVTCAENLRRGWSPSAMAAKQETCVRGHRFDGFARGQRTCRACARDATRRYRARELSAPGVAP